MYDPEGALATVPTVMSAWLGTHFGRVLKYNQPKFASNSIIKHWSYMSTLLIALGLLIHFTFFNDKSTVYSTEKIDLGSSNNFTDYNLKDSIGNLYKVNKSHLGNTLFYSVQSPNDRNEVFDFKNNGGVFTSNGENLYIGIDKSLFKYKLENISFNEYLNERFLLKPYIFIISFGIMLMFVLLFNDKIKAR